MLGAVLGAGALVLTGLGVYRHVQLERRVRKVEDDAKAHAEDDAREHGVAPGG